MKIWVSKPRVQQTKARLKQATRILEAGPIQPGGWRASFFALFFGFMAWLSALVLMQAGHSFPQDFASIYRLVMDGLLLMLGVIICGTFLRINTGPHFHTNFRSMLLLVVLALYTLIPVRIVLALEGNSFFPWPSTVIMFLFPLGLAPLMATLMAGGAAGMVVGLWTSFASAVFADHNYYILIGGLLVTGVVVSMSHSVRRRTRLIKIGFTAGMTQIFIVILLAALREEPSMVILIQSIACIAGGLGTALLAVILLPLTETAFELTTDITLQDVSDLSHPLLQRLAIEAPGTYHHSLMVANLAQAAAYEVGADATLVRAGAYFHDIGKLTKPELFAENMQSQDNPHDELSPNMSALLITTHTKEGVSFAILSKLPRIVMDIIQQHHGTSLVSFFHRKAQEKINGETGREGGTRPATRAFIEESDFRYPGPKPQTKEAGLIMMADAVEAASRSLAKPTPSHIRNLVEGIVKGKLVDGQLEQCDLSLSDINKAKDAFVFTLTSMLHSRIAYPKNENRPPQPSTPAAH